jgi:hypothetical protein
MQRDLHRRGIDVVRALAHVDVVERMQEGVIAPAAAHQLERAIGDHLVRVHVGRGAGAALDHVHDELLEQAPIADFLARLGDRPRPLVVEEPELVVGDRRGKLNAGERAHQLGVDRDGGPGNGKVLERPQGVHPVVGAGRNRPVA